MRITDSKYRITGLDTEPPKTPQNSHQEAPTGTEMHKWEYMVTWALTTAVVAVLASILIPFFTGG
jgi:hypothetical protein